MPAIDTRHNFAHPLSCTTSRLQEAPSSGTGRSKTSASVIENARISAARRARLIARNCPSSLSNARRCPTTGADGVTDESRPSAPSVGGDSLVGRARGSWTLGTAIVITDKKSVRPRAIERADERASHRPPFRHAQGGPAATYQRNVHYSRTCTHPVPRPPLLHLALTA